jgi:hypothetical protein
MIPDHVVADSLSIARDLLLRQYQQIVSGWNFAGEMHWSHLAILLILAVGLFLLSVRETTRNNFRPIVGVVVVLVAVLYVLDWRQRDLTLRVEQRAERIESALLANPPLGFADLAKVTREPIPPSSWSDSAWPGLEGALVYGSVAVIVALAGVKIFRRGGVSEKSA